MARPGILNTYRDTMVSHLIRKFKLKKEDAFRRVTEICRERYRGMTAVVAENVIDGKPVLKAVDLVSYLDQHAGDLISPSGSIYCQHEKKIGATIEMVQRKLKQRKKLKKEMLKAKAVGDTVKELIAYYGQTLIKIGVNSLPGNYGSKYSIFYDKGNYNAITSSGRGLIGYANTCIEHVLGGNFGWFTIDQLVNHVTIHLGTIDHDQVNSVLDAHKLRRVSKDELIKFFKDELMIYHRYKDLSEVDRLVATLDDTEVQFFWYYQNLRHIIMGNDGIFRPYFEQMFNLDNVKDDPKSKPEDLFELDGALVTMCNVAFFKYVDPKDPEIQVYDLPKARPDLAVKFVNIAKHVQKQLHRVDDIFNCFIFTKLCVPDVQNRKLMLRNSSVVSDTDSVIFTVKDWVDWYTHDIYKISDGTYHIACCMIYWITLAVAHALKLFSISHGATGEYVKTMAMKNEFLYPTMCLADIKKHYAGVVTVQEGVILSEPSPDIKGVQFKGSDLCKEATKFAEDLIVKDTLLASLNHKIEGRPLINKVMEFEQLVYNDTRNGITRWCEPLSIKDKTGYKNPLSSNYFYYLAWQEIFAKKYGEILIPSKTIVVPIAEPTKEYFDYLHKEDRTIAKNFENFILKYGKAPSFVAINPISNKIPKELIPLVQIRKIVYANTAPCKLFLKQLGIDCGFDKDQLLFTEVYGDHSMLSRLTDKTKEIQNVQH